MSIGNIGNNTECFGNKCQRNKDKPCVIHYGENRFFSKDKFWNNCFRCNTEKEVICMRSNGDEVIYIFIIVSIKLYNILFLNNCYVKGQNFLRRMQYKSSE